jgi:dihydrofolate synthase/folylpolyglutamate synthase
LLDRLFALETFGIKLGLENISRLCAALGHPERSFVTLHIAGTNGKGSVAAMTHAAFLAAGVRAARYTSPHLTDITERFMVGDRAVDITVLERTVARVLDCAAGLQTTGELRVPPTFFEAATATAFELFRASGIEVAVVEVGLGGRFDATNVITPAVGAITTIGYDHQQYLGDTLAEIAFEKAGIIKPGIPIVIGALPPEAATVVRRVAAERRAQVIDAAHDATVTSDMDDGAARVSIRTPDDTYGPLVLGLRGAHQMANALVTVRLLEAARAHAGIGLPRAAIEAGLARPDWPGRLELFPLPGGQRVLMDAAHNIDGATALAEHLRIWHPERPALVFGVMHDKDVDAMLRALIPAVSSLTATAAPTPRAMPPEELARRARRIAGELAQSGAGVNIPITVVTDPKNAVDTALSRTATVCVAGSIFLAGAVREGLRRRALQR